jgi:hypothetical protein
VLNVLSLSAADLARSRFGLIGFVLCVAAVVAFAGVGLLRGLGDNVVIPVGFIVGAVEGLGTLLGLSFCAYSLFREPSKIPAVAGITLLILAERYMLPLFLVVSFYFLISVLPVIVVLLLVWFLFRKWRRSKKA